MQEPHLKESLLYSSSPIVRQAPGSNSTMRKYQQLTLAVVAVVSLVAFVYYKHEYERLRYTLEYMDTFGEPPPADAAQPQQCWFMAQMRAATPLAEWTTVARDVAVYSSFWDDNGGISEAKLRTIAIIEKTAEPPSALKVKLWYETGQFLTASCEMEKAESRSHVIGESKVFHIVYILCIPDYPEGTNHINAKAPYLVQFGNGGGEWTDFKSVHESDNFKTVVDRSAVCVVPSRIPKQSINIVEFISFYQLLGFQKFVFYGNGLTPVTRKLLNKYIDEMGIMVEEKSFNYIPSLQSLENNLNNKGNLAVLEYITRQVVELDCQYRHRDTFENVVVLQSNEFIVPNKGQSLIEVLKALSVGGGPGKVVSEFHLITQHVCVDRDHPSSSRMPSELLLGHQSRSNGRLEEAGVAVLRPYLITSPIGRAGAHGISQQHVSSASAVVYRSGRLYCSITVVWYLY